MVNKARGCKEGSAILIVTLIMSALLLSCLNLFKSTILTVDFVLKRQEREQKTRAVQGVLNFGIDMCSKRFSEFMKMAQEGKKNWSFSVGKWKIGDLGPYDGQLSVSYKEKKLHLSATLLEQNSCAFGIGCELARKKRGDRYFFCVSNWREYV